MDINSLPFVRSSFTVRRAQGSLPESERTANVPFQNYESEPPRNDSSAVSSAQLGGVWRVTVHRQSQLKSSNCLADCAVDSPNKLPAPSKLKKRHSESEGSIPMAKKKSKRMDIRDHLAQLKRKQLHFDLNEICVDSSFSDSVEPQQVPGSPKLPLWTTHYGNDAKTLAPYGEAVLDDECATNQGWERDSSLSYIEAVEENQECDQCDQHQEDIYQPQLAPTESSFCTLPHTDRSVHEEENFAEVPTLHNRTITTTGLRMPAFDDFMVSAEPCTVDVSSFSITNYYPREE